jgi:hypothetical protein
MNTYYGMPRTSGATASSNNTFSAAATAFIIFLGIAAAYIAYTWYSGRKTVPSPSYITGGFQNPNNKTAVLESDAPSEEFADLGVTGNTKRAEAFFKATSEEFKAQEPLRVEGTEAFQVVTSPAPYKEGAKEGFYGGAAKGAGSPDCLRASSEAAQLIAMFASKGPSTVVEGGDDLRELTQLAGKLSCFKKDLLSPSFIVDATRKQQFVTMHDIEPIAETTGRCFAKTISPRDLELAFNKWSSRGNLLIKRLCTAFKLSPDDVDKSESLFRALLRDVQDVSRSACFVGEPTIAGKPGPRDPHPYVNPEKEGYGEFTGYY